MATATAEMTQLNLRVSKEDKRQAEDVLHLMGTTTTELVRKLMAKVARGAKDYAELASVLEVAPAEPAAEEESPQYVDPVLAEGWAIVDDFCRLLGYESASDVPVDTRSWEERYEDAMIAKGREKGWLQ